MGGLAPCDNCGAPMRWETSHQRCDTCGHIVPCCEGAPLGLTRRSTDGQSRRGEGVQVRGVHRLLPPRVARRPLVVALGYGCGQRRGAAVLRSPYRSRRRSRRTSRSTARVSSRTHSCPGAPASECRRSQVTRRSYNDGMVSYWSPADDRRRIALAGRPPGAAGARPGPQPLSPSTGVRRWARVRWYRSRVLAVRSPEATSRKVSSRWSVSSSMITMVSSRPDRFRRHSLRCSRPSDMAGQVQPGASRRVGWRPSGDRHLVSATGMTGRRSSAAPEPPRTGR